MNLLVFVSLPLSWTLLSRCYSSLLLVSLMLRISLLLGSDFVSLSLLQTEEETQYVSLDLALKVSKVGVSLISDSLGEELCYASLSQVAMGLQQRGDRQKVFIRIQDVQIDNQMEGGRHPVVLANRGGRTRDTTDPQGRVSKKCIYNISIIHL